jgi:hypothetical protein
MRYAMSAANGSLSRKPLAPIATVPNSKRPSIKDTENYPFIGDVIDQLKIGRTAFYKYFPTDRIKQLRPDHSETSQT